TGEEEAATRWKTSGRSEKSAGYADSRFTSMEPGSSTQSWRRNRILSITESIFILYQSVSARASAALWEACSWAIAISFIRQEECAKHSAAACGRQASSQL